MANSPEKERGNFSFSQLVAVLKKWLWLIVAIIIVFGALGFGYSKVKKPVYTASQVINYTAHVDGNPDDYPANINAMRRYVYTVVDFCDEGIVLDCANDIYQDYLGSGLTVDEYITTFSGIANVSETDNVYFTKSMISAKELANFEEEVPSFVINLSLKGPSVDVARAKLRILSLAIGIEAKDAFGGVTTYLTETVDKSADITCTASTSTRKNVMVFMILGAIVSLFAVYLICVFDRTVKDKDTFEEITQSNLIAYIEYQED